MNLVLTKNSRKDDVTKETIKQAKDWYKRFVGTFEVDMDEKELVEIYREISA